MISDLGVILPRFTDWTEIKVDGTDHSFAIRLRDIEYIIAKGELHLGAGIEVRKYVAVDGIWYRFRQQTLKRVWALTVYEGLPVFVSGQYAVDAMVEFILNEALAEDIVLSGVEELVKAHESTVRQLFRSFSPFILEKSGMSAKAA